MNNRTLFHGLCVFIGTLWLLSFFVGCTWTPPSEFERLYPSPTIDHFDHARVTSGSREDEQADAGIEQVPTFTWELTYVIPPRVDGCKDTVESCIPSAIVRKLVVEDQSDRPEVQATYQGFLGAFVKSSCKQAPDGSLLPPCPADGRKLGLQTLTWATCTSESVGASPPPKGMCVIGEVFGLVDEKGALLKAPPVKVQLSPAEAERFREIVKTLGAS